MNSDSMTFGAALLAAREKSKLAKTTIAKLAKFSGATLSRLESGKTTIPPETLESITYVYNSLGIDTSNFERLAHEHNVRLTRERKMRAEDKSTVTTDKLPETLFENPTVAEETEYPPLYNVNLEAIKLEIIKRIIDMPLGEAELRDINKVLNIVESSFA